MSLSATHGPRDTPFSVRDTLALALRILERAWGRLVGLAVAQAVLTWVLTTLVAKVLAPVAPYLVGLVGFAIKEAGIALATGAIVAICFTATQDGHLGVGEALSASARRFAPMLAVCVLETVAIGLGMLLLVVPGLILVVVLAAAVPACMIEELGPVESMTRSVALTRGHRWPLFGLLLLAMLVGLVAVAAILLPFLHTGVLTISAAILGVLVILALLLVSLALSTAIYVALRDAQPAPTPLDLGPAPRAAL